MSLIKKPREMEEAKSPKRATEREGNALGVQALRG